MRGRRVNELESPYKRELIETSRGEGFAFGKNYVGAFQRVDCNGFRDWSPPQTEICLTRYDGVILDGAFRCLFDENGLLEESVYLDKREYLRTLNPFEALSKPVQSADCYIMGCNELHNNYFHWLTQCLPAIYLMYSRRLRTEKTVVLVPKLNEWQRSSLALLGINAEFIEEIDQGKAYYLSSCLHSNILTGAAAFGRSALLCDFFRRIKSFVVGRSTSQGFGKAIYIPRGDASHRKLTNEDELTAVLTSIGFEICFCSQMSVEEQVREFSSAALVVAPHGAGLTNVAFCEPGTFVYEILPRFYPNNCFNSLSLQQNLVYWADMFDDPGTGERIIHKRDWCCSVQAVIERVGEIRTFMKRDAYQRLCKFANERHLISQLAEVALSPLAASSPDCEYILVTHAGHTVEYDRMRRELVHYRGSSWSNVICVLDGRSAILGLIDLDGVRSAISIRPSCYLMVPGLNIGPLSESPQVFQAHYDDHCSQNHLSLYCGGLYLCAESDGSLSLSRGAIGAWERFRLFPAFRR